MLFRKTGLALAIAGVASSAAGQTGPDKNNLIETMVVTASLTEQTTQTAPAFTSVVTGEEILSVPITALPEILGQAPGVHDYSDSSGRDELQVRGMSGSYTLVLLNGKRVSSSSALWRGGDFDLSSVPLSSIEQVEIVRGPMSSLYGADAIGGVINIITKAPEPEWRGNINGEYRLVDTGDGGAQSRAGFSAQGPLTETLALSVAADKLKREAWYIDGEQEGLNSPKLEEKEAVNFYSTLRWALSDSQHLEFDVGVNDDDRPYDAYYAAGEIRDFREQNIRRSTYGVSHFGDWGWGSTTLQVQLEDGTIDDYNSRYDEPQQRELTEENFIVRGYSHFSLGESNAITAGFDYREQTVGDPVSYVETGEIAITDAALFLQDEISLSERLTLTLGGRLDDNEFFGSHFTPRAYLVFELSDSFSLKGGYSEAFKAPGGYQLSEEYKIVSCGGSCFLSGNKNLQPETSENYEIGFSAGQDSWELSAVYFENDVTDMISAQYDAVNNQRYWDNVNQVETSGVEVDGAVYITPDFSLRGNYTRLDTENSATGEPLENRPEQLANLQVSWDIVPLLSASLVWNYIGEQEAYAGADLVTLPGYSRVDLGLSSRLTDSFELRYGVKNLTDVQTQEEDENFSTYELGRNFYLSASYQF